ncbi:LemA family protein [Amycolatopsis endophytica]|uniref:LemA protein n=1 Tax=Amycolatopsis endophytica TaxID=860233 RepID=A0A853AXU4_9PSEU|nr:LemA family protein [Amycolatopsis endophytica]NYI87457.1 LemA protein [Amycolatopsis endophytica]
MGTGGIVAIVIVVVVVLALLIGTIAAYNGLVRRRNAYQNAFAQIDVQLTRRHDLIPNLVETAKAYLRHERQTLEAVVAARGGAMQAQQAARVNPGDPGAMQQLDGAENVLSQALGRLFALTESYPDLKANQNMMQLSEELTSTENRVAFARQGYNDSVMGYNTKREVFPGNLIAGMFGFAPAALLAAETPEARQAPRISF